MLTLGCLFVASRQPTTSPGPGGWVGVGLPFGSFLSKADSRPLETWGGGNWNRRVKKHGNVGSTGLE